MSDLTIRMYERETEAGTVLSVDLTMADGRSIGLDVAADDWQEAVGQVIDAAVALNV